MAKITAVVLATVTEERASGAGGFFWTSSCRQWTAVESFEERSPISRLSRKDHVGWIGDTRGRVSGMRS